MTWHIGDLTPWRKERILNAISNFGFGEIDIGIRTLTAVLHDACPVSRRWELPWGDDVKVPIHTVVLEALVLTEPRASAPARMPI